MSATMDNALPEGYSHSCKVTYQNSLPSPATPPRGLSLDRLYSNTDRQSHDTPQHKGLESGSRDLRILIAPAGFKEALGPEAVALALEEGLRRVVDQDTAAIAKLPLHDGGEGFCKALVTAYGGEIRDLTVMGPVGQPVRSYFGLIDDNQTTAVLDSKSTYLPQGTLTYVDDPTYCTWVANEE